MKKRVLSHSRSIRSGSFSSTSIAAMHAAATAGGCEVEKRNGRAALDQVVLEVLAPGDVAAHHADRLGQRADLDVDPAVEVEVVDRAAPVAAQHARRVGVVDHDRRLVSLGHVADARERRDVAVHREHAVGDDQDRADTRPFGPPVARASRSTFSRPSTSLCGKTARDAFDSRTPSMIEAWFSSSLTIRSASVVIAGIDAAVGGEARLERQHRLDVLEVGQPPLQLLDAAPWRRRWCARRPVPTPSSRTAFERRLHEVRMGRQPEVVVRRQADDGRPSIVVSAAWAPA